MTLVFVYKGEKMQIKTGKIIYSVLTITLLLLMLLPGSTTLLHMSINRLNELDSWHLLIPDMLSLLLLALGYCALRFTYKRYASYIKLYPAYIFGVLIIWTIITYVK